MNKINVNMGPSSYSIHIGNTWDPALFSEILSGFKAKKALIVADSNTGPLYGREIEGLIASADIEVKRITIAAGEAGKSVDTAMRLYSAALEFQMDRSSLFIALGGGVTGDLAGFAASTYMRGVSYIQIPTSLLAQVDSSIGGKTAVNHPRAKNIIGTFYQPGSVIINTETLKTLPRRQLSSGLAEVIKYGVIADCTFLEYLEHNMAGILSLDDAALSVIIERSCAIKAHIVALDEREHGPRAILNFGHTVGHAVEAISGFSAVTHGEAVAIGMVVEASMAMLLGRISVDYVSRLKTLLRAAGLPVELPQYSNDKLIELMRHDKKNTEDSIVFILPSAAGHGEALSNISKGIITEALNLSRQDKL